MADAASQLRTVGRLGAVYGVHGWVRVQSFTDPPEQLFDYRDWWLKTRHGVKAVEILEFKPHSDGWVAKIKGYDDRELAKTLANVEIAVDVSEFPELEQGDYYWYQLEGLSVTSHYEGKITPLGKVRRMMETGANDVLVVVDQNNRERLVPYLPDQVVKKVDLEAGDILVEWDPEF